MFLKVLIFFNLILLSISSFARPSICSQFLEINYDIIDINDLNSYGPYVEAHKQLKNFAAEESVRKIATLFNNFKDKYHDRYNAYANEAMSINPKLETDHMGFKETMDPFMKYEAYFVEQFQKTILKLPAKKRIHYLKSLSPERLKRDSLLLDSLFGIGVNKVFDYIHSDWETLIRFTLSMDLQITSQTVGMDLTHGKGARFGLLMSILYPESSFVGVVADKNIMTTYNEIIRQSGLQNINYITQNQINKLEVNSETNFIYLLNK